MRATSNSLHLTRDDPPQLYAKWRVLPILGRRRLAQAVHDAACVGYNDAGLRGRALEAFVVDNVRDGRAGNPLLAYIAIEILIAIIKLMLKRWLIRRTN